VKLLFNQQTAFHNISVYDTEELDGKRGRFRILQFGTEASQGALDLNQPDRILFEYPRAILHLMEFHNPDFGHVFAIGHGIGTIAAACPGRRFLTAELDPLVVQLSREYFGCQQQDILIGDGRQLLQEQDPGSFDYLILDAFTAEGTPAHLVSQEMFELASSRLHEGGMLLMNVTGRPGYDRRLGAIFTTLGQSFSHVIAFSLPPQSQGDRLNVILAASMKPILYQGRQMAGFQEIQLPPGYVIRDY
jgi:spermidine synthase